MKHLLFLTPNANRTGAPILLLEFMTWLKANVQFEMSILFEEGGVLVPEFKQIATVYVLNTTRFLNASYRFNQFWNKLRSKKIVRVLKQKPFHLIYANTIAVYEILSKVHQKGIPVVSHIHELEFAIQHYGEENLKSLDSVTQTFISVSEAVSQNLLKNHGISSDKIVKVHGFVPERKQISSTDQKTLNKPFLVCACGTLDWRKGSDLFLALAQKVTQKEPNIHFLWIGGDKTSGFYREREYDIKKMGIETHITFVGEVENPLVYMAECDVFALMSREDPFPLVMLEAASVGLPIIAFKNSGGAEEFVTEGIGRVVEYADVDRMATCILDYYVNKQEPLKEARIRYVSEYHGIGVISRELLEVINENAN